MPEQSNLKQAALDYAGQGWYVFPIKPRAKNPPLVKWSERATSDPEQIEAWWTEEPNANIGLACGPSHVAVIDLDVKSADGIKAWAETAKNGSETVTSLTPSGGKHLIYHSNGAHYSNSNKRLPEGIDVRGDGGYILLPPSIIESQSYRWVGEQIPSPHDCAPVPDWLDALLERTGEWPEQAGSRIAIVRDPVSYTIEALLSELQRMRSAQTGSRNETLASVATSLGQLIGGGMLPKELTVAALRREALLAGMDPLADNLDDTLARQIAWGIRRPRKVLKDGRDARIKKLLEENRAYVIDLDTGAISIPLKRIGHLLGQDASSQDEWNLSELMATPFKPLRWFVDGLFPEGLAILAGRPKVGKSLLALQLIKAVVDGGKVLGRDCPTRGKVLLIALEDGPRRLQSRFQRNGIKNTQDVDIRFKWPRADEGGTDMLLDTIEKGQYALVIIDTLSRFTGKVDQMDVGGMTDLLGPIQQLSLKRGILTLLIDHHKKAMGDENTDPIDDILGSTAKAAVADAAVGLYHKANRKDYFLKSATREAEPLNLSVKLQEKTLTWKCFGSVDFAVVTRNEQRVLDAIEDLQAQGRSTGTTDIAQYTGLPKGRISGLLKRLADKDRVERAETKNAEGKLPWTILEDPEGE